MKVKIDNRAYGMAWIYFDDANGDVEAAVRAAKKNVVRAGYDPDFWNEVARLIPILKTPKNIVDIEA